MRHGSAAVRAGFAFMVGFGLCAETTAQSIALDDVSVYAGGTLVFESFSSVAGGAVAAGDDITHEGGTLNVESIFGGGGFAAESAAFQNTAGPVSFTDSVIGLGGPGSVIDGDVVSTNGSVIFNNSSVTVNGDVAAGLRVSLPFTFSTINGDVTTGPGAGAFIEGTVNGTVSPGQATDLPAFVLPGLPAGSNLNPGTNNIALANFQDIDLAPGTYGTLEFASSNTVNLSAGTYVFADITSDFALNELAFDASAGAITVFVAAPDLTLDLVQVVNDERLFAGGTPAPNDAADITLELAGSFQLDSAFYGTILAPNGDLTLSDFADVTGRVLAGGNVVIGDADINAVPEPAGAVVLLATLGFATRRRRGGTKALQSIVL